MIHEDNRRILESWPEAKTITAKEDCVLGDHYHKIKTEKFILIEGECNFRMGITLFPMKIGQTYTVPPAMRHSFHLKKDSVLIGLCSHPYDPTDDYK